MALARSLSGTSRYRPNSTQRKYVATFVGMSFILIACAVRRRPATPRAPGIGQLRLWCAPCSARTQDAGRVPSAAAISSVDFMVSTWHRLRGVLVAVPPSLAEHGWPSGQVSVAHPATCVPHCSAPPNLGGRSRSSTSAQSSTCHSGHLHSSHSSSPCAGCPQSSHFMRVPCQCPTPPPGESRGQPAGPGGL